MKNMKKLKLATAVAASVVATMLCQTANATLLFPYIGTSDLPSDGDAPPDITVNWEVDYNGAVYQYNYTITDTTPGGVAEFQVNLDTALVTPGSVTGGQAGSGINAGLGAVVWYINPPLESGTSGILSFTSDFPPTSGGASAGGAPTPPAPWSSYPDGQQVPVPGVPDGGSTVTLLGGALLGLRALARKKS